MNEKNIAIIRIIAGVVSLLWAAFWIFYGLFSGLPEGGGFSGFLYHAPNALPGIIMLISAAIAWRCATVGGVILCVESLLIVVGYPLLSHSKTHITTIIYIILGMGIPPMFSGLLFIVSGKLCKRYRMSMNHYSSSD